MGHGKVMASLRKGWIFGLLRVGIMAVFMITRVKSQDQIGVPATGLLCISECATCPVICAPPPPPLASLPPPEYYSPPESYYSYQSPPLPLSPPTMPYYSWATPPPPFTYLDIPSPPISGLRGYSYPYYFFYASKATCVPLSASFSSFFLLLLLLFSHVVFLCW